MVKFDFFHKKCGGRKANDLATDSWCARKRFVNMTKTSDRRAGKYLTMRFAHCDITWEGGRTKIND